MRPSRLASPPSRGVVHAITSGLQVARVTDCSSALGELHHKIDNALILAPLRNEVSHKPQSSYKIVLGDGHESPGEPACGGGAAPTWRAGDGGRPSVHARDLRVPIAPTYAAIARRRDDHPKSRSATAVPAGSAPEPHHALIADLFADVADAQPVWGRPPAQPKTAANVGEGVPSGASTSSLTGPGGRVRPTTTTAPRAHAHSITVFAANRNRVSQDGW